MISYQMEVDGRDIKRAINVGFNYMESQDEIVGLVYANPKLVKDIILSMPEEVDFDYIPNGVGYLRTAYLKFSHVREKILKLENVDRTQELKIILI